MADIDGLTSCYGARARGRATLPTQKVSSPTLRSRCGAGTPAGGVAERGPALSDSAERPDRLQQCRCRRPRVGWPSVPSRHGGLSPIVARTPKADHLGSSPEASASVLRRSPIVGPLLIDERDASRLARIPLLLLALRQRQSRFRRNDTCDSGQPTVAFPREERASPTLTEPAHVALHTPFCELELRAAVRARAHEHLAAHVAEVDLRQRLLRRHRRARDGHTGGRRGHG